MKVDKIVQYTEKNEIEIVGATLLSVEEAKLLTEEERRYFYWWWLRSPGCPSTYAACINFVGVVYYYGDEVDNDSGCIRPALVIKNLESSNLKIGDVFKFKDYEFRVISENLAWMHKQDIGYHCFRKEWKSEDANDYEKSDVKKIVDEWFNDLIKE